MTSSFGRSYQLIFTAVDKSQLFFEQTTKQGLMIEFDISKTNTTSPNEATIRITNPGTDTIASLEKEGTIELYAGYKGDIALILAGDKQSILYEDEGGTKTIVITVLEGSTSYKNQLISANYNIGSTTTQIIADIVLFIIANVPSIKAVNEYVILGPKVYILPQVVFGPAFQLLEQFLEPLRYEFFVNNGVITILPQNGYIKDIQVPLNSKTGMIGSPKPVMEAGASKSSRRGISVKSILNYNFDVGRTILVNSNDITNEVFRIESVTFTGNSFEGDWICDIRAFELDGI